MLFHPSQVPVIGQTVTLNVSMAGHRYEMTRINDEQCSFLVNGIHKAFFDYPKKSKSGFGREDCNWIVDGDFWGRSVQSYLAPLPHTFKCPLRRWLAERGHSQKMLVFATEVTIVKQWDDFPEWSAADPSCGEDIAHSEDWVKTDLSPDEFEAHTFKYTGGTVAVVARVNDRDTCTRRLRTVTKFVVNPTRKAEALVWLQEQSNQPSAFPW